MDEWNIVAGLDMAFWEGRLLTNLLYGVTMRDSRTRASVDVAALGDAELRISLARLAASRSQAEIAANITTLLGALLAAQGQNIRRR
jgi:hypothetical protein